MIEKIVQHPPLVEGHELIPCAIGPDGWLYVPHVDGQWVTAAKLQPFSLAIVGCWLEEQPAPPHVTDTEILDFVADDHLSLIAFEMLESQGNGLEIGWEVRQNLADDKQRHVVGISHHDDLRSAIRNAMQALGYDAINAKATGEPA